MHREAVDVLPKLLATFGIAQPMLFGHSDGASVALIYAATTTLQPAALVVEAPHVFVEDVTVARIGELRDAYHGPTNLRRGLERHHGANVDRLFTAWTGMWLSPEFREWNIEALLPAIASPVLVIQGAHDEYGTVKQVDTIARSVKGPVATLVLDRCRHAPHVDQRDQVLAAAAEFLKQARGR
jgi:pimeloyl-ACP methyl ester carboxylesterase